MSLEDEIKKEGEFEYLEQGEGHTIILLHGLFGALSNFKDVIDAFSSNYKIVVPIMPLYTMPIIKTNVISLGKFVARFIKHKKFEKVTLLGNSLGGHVALVYALNNMHKVHSLVLTGSSGLYENAFGGSFPRREDKEFLRKKIAVTFYDQSLADDVLVDEVFEIVNDRSKLIRILAIAKSAIRHNMAKDLSRFEMPSCLIWGKNDTITPPEVAEEFHQLIQNSELFWIDKCGHAAMMEHPKEFNRILNEWLAKIT
ncbi:MAG: alpha/beta hydrolase [Vicingaceae bacterium]